MLDPTLPVLDPTLPADPTQWRDTRPRVVMTPTDVIREALANAPAIRVALAAYQALTAQAKGAFQPANPTLTLGAGTINDTSNSSYFNQVFELFGEPGLRGSAAKQKARIAAANLDAAQREAVREAVKAYYTMWTSAQNYYLAKAYTAEITKLHTLAVKQSGKQPTHAVLRSQVELASANADQITARAQRDADVARLNAAIGRIDEVKIRIPDLQPGVDLEPLPDPFTGAIPSLETLLALSMSRPEVIASLRQIDQTRLLARLSNLSGNPTARISGSTSGYNISNASPGVDFSLSFPLFDWGTLKANRIAAWKTYEGAKESVNVTILQVHLQVNTAFQAWRSALLRRNMLRTNIDDIRENFDTAYTQYEAGKISVDDTINTLKGSREAFSKYLEAEGDVHSARVEVLWASGMSLALPPDAPPAGSDPSATPPDRHDSSSAPSGAPAPAAPEPTPPPPKTP